MRKTVPFYQIDGQPMLAPDADPQFTFNDLDSSDSGRDESGVLRRIVVREKVGSWSFAYSYLTDEEYAAIVHLFPANPPLLSPTPPPALQPIHPSPLAIAATTAFPGETHTAGCGRI